jgi:hypothetical protein
MFDEVSFGHVKRGEKKVAHQLHQLLQYGIQDPNKIWMKETFHVVLY